MKELANGAITWDKGGKLVSFIVLIAGVILSVNGKIGDVKDSLSAQLATVGSAVSEVRMNQAVSLSEHAQMKEQILELKHRIARLEEQRFEGGKR